MKNPTPAERTSEREFVVTLADPLVVDGNPLEDIRLLENPEQNLRVIVKDGHVVSSTP
jgi:imidazolonepropionase-like amidohydrolase